MPSPILVPGEGRAIAGMALPLRFPSTSVSTAPGLPRDDPAAPIADGAEYLAVTGGERLRFGDIVADRVTQEIGSWRFILLYFTLLLLWMGLNTVAWVRQWDPYPFIFLNLVLSFQGAFAAPILLMSQNRQERKDRLAEQDDHAVNRQAEQEVAAVQARIDELGGGSLAELAALRAEQQAVHERLDAVLALLERHAQSV